MKEQRPKLNQYGVNAVIAISQEMNQPAELRARIVHDDGRIDEIEDDYSLVKSIEEIISLIESSCIVTFKRLLLARVIMVSPDKAKREFLEKADFNNWYPAIVEIADLVDKRYPIKRYGCLEALRLEGNDAN